jgi:predicted ATPase
LIRKDDLLARVWPEVHVDDAARRVHISALRKALGISLRGEQYIANVAGPGYRFIGQLVESAHAVAAAFSPAGALLEGDQGSAARIIGRDFAVQTLLENLPVKRFVTVTGPGGMGNTTVALAVAARLPDEYRDGLQFVDLTSLSDPALVLQEVASQLQLLGFSFQSDVDLVASLQDRQMFLVLDNCEHLAEPVALLVERILAAARAVHILTTSREPLRAMGEWVHRLPPLALPPPVIPLNAAEILNSPSVTLFIERCRAANDSFVLADADLPSVVGICHRVDGIPLAIELAAARVDLLGVQVLAKLLNESFDLLTGGRRTALPGQRTLRATLNWSYELLSEDERAVFCRFATFRGSFTLDAAKAVAKERDSKLSLLDHMAALVDKSLISVVSRAHSTLYRLFETTRAYASEKLVESGELDEVMRRHADYFCLLGSGPVNFLAYKANG